MLPKPMPTCSNQVIDCYGYDKKRTFETEGDHGSDNRKWSRETSQQIEKPSNVTSTWATNWSK